jgi:hypothetical protein
MIEDDTQMTRAEVVALMESIVHDLRRGGPTFLAVAVLTPNAYEPSRAVTIACKFSDEESPTRINEAFATLTQNAIKIGALVVH